MDRYGRVVAVCTVNGQDIGEWMVRHGWALDYERYSDGAYREAEDAARRDGAGMWAGEFTAPWQWRREH